MKSLIARLAEAAGPSGYENQVRSLVKEEIEPFVDELRVDNLGNLIARKGSRAEKGLKVMLAAHLDEVGLIVGHVDEKGFARFTPLGPLELQAAIGSKVRFLNGSLGLIGAENHPEGQKNLSFDQLYIDLGASSRRECPVTIGDTAVFESSFTDLGARIVGKALDDRAGIAVLIEALRQMREQKINSPHEIYFVFSAQEKVGSRGAAVAAFAIDPDVGLSVTLAQSSGTPRGPKMSIQLDKGPAIKVRDQRMISNPRLVDWIAQTAEKSHIPYQMEISEDNPTDAHAIQLSRAGVSAAGLSIPARYLHSPNEMASYDDLQNTLHLLLALLGKPIELES